MAIRALNSLTTPGGANQESVNFSSLQYFKLIPGFTVSSYLDARGYQLRSLIELFVCRYIINTNDYLTVFILLSGTVIIK